MFLEPDPNQWLTAQRLVKLERDFSSARSTLAICGLLRASIGGWVRHQIAEEAPLDTQQRVDYANKQKESWLAKYNLEDFCLTEEELVRKINLQVSCEAWSDAKWNCRLHSLFLSRKEELDQASCRILFVSNKGLALELYHRIKDSEDSFDEVAKRFSEGLAKSQGGLIPKQPLGRMPLGLKEILPRLKTGELLQPTRLGDKFVIVRLEEWEPSSFDEGSRRFLLNEELDLWVDSVVKLALAHLNYSCIKA